MMELACKVCKSHAKLLACVRPRRIYGKTQAWTETVNDITF